MKSIVQLRLEAMIRDLSFIRSLDRWSPEERDHLGKASTCYLKARDSIIEGDKEFSLLLSADEEYLAIQNAEEEQDETR